jgi:phage tail sheath protein FI
MESIQATQQAMLDHAENMGDRVAILDSPPGLKPKDVDDWRWKQMKYDSSYGALYYPWIKVMDPRLRKTRFVPPSGHMAGIWARSDSERGVHKAPANEIVRGAIGLEYEVNKGEQAVLNPHAINCIRAFPGRGIRVWGARTLSSDPSWRYLNVRRLFNYLEKSIELGTQWIVFEPNDMDLWERIKRNITAFLTVVWRTGALFGAAPTDAFYVKCDAETNPPEQIDLGMVVTEIGVCPVKPAEFVIFRIGQHEAGATVS